MAVLKIPYPNLNESLKYLRLQIIDSLKYCNQFKKLKTLEDVFNFCKSRFNYKSDPLGVEYFQTVETLLKNNGLGDCDDATIFVLSILCVNNFDNFGIVLAGRNKYRPTHIYCYAYENGKKFNLDLTNKNFNQIRNYPFKQFIPFVLTPNEKNMYLQLADGGNVFNRIKTIQPKIKRLNSLQKHSNAFYLPSKNVYIPFDRFDLMQPKTVKNTLLSEGYDNEQIETFLSGRAERKARRQARQERKKERYEFRKAKREEKIEKRRAKNENRRARAEIKRARADKKRMSGESKKMRATAKILKSKSKIINAERGNESPINSIFRNVGGAVKNFINREPQDEQQDYLEPQDTEAPEYTDYTDVTDIEQQDYLIPQDTEVPEYTDYTDVTDVEQQDYLEPQYTELQEGTNSNLILGGLFLAGIFIERKKLINKIF